MSESTTDPTASPAVTATPGSRPSVVLGSVALDTDEPRRLADFYAALLGWEVLRDDEDWAAIGPAGQSVAAGEEVEAPLAFQLVINYTPPTWPTQVVPQQFHIDFNVADLDEGERFAISLGGRRVPTTGGETSFRVFLDPSGHPFCLCQG